MCNIYAIIYAIEKVNVNVGKAVCECSEGLKIFQMISFMILIKLKFAFIIYWLNSWAKEAFSVFCDWVQMFKYKTRLSFKTRNITSKTKLEILAVEKRVLCFLKKIIKIWDVEIKIFMGAKRFSKEIQ